ncbi:hypothetical protein ABEF93_003525 [Exophiala dermatitidis]
MSTASRHVLAMLLAIVFSILGVICAICLVVCLRRVRSRSRDARATPDDLSTVKSSVRSPEQESGQTNTPSSTSGYAGSDIPVPPTGPPKIDLSWSDCSLRNSKLRFSEVGQTTEAGYAEPGDGETSLQKKSQQFKDAHGLLAQSSRSLATDRAESARNLPMASTSLGSAAVLNQVVHNRASLLPGMQSIPHPVAGLPTRKSGAGHGAGISVRSEADMKGSSWRGSWLSNSASEHRRYTVGLDSLPPPRRERSRQGTTASVATTYLQTDPGVHDFFLSFETRRQKWYTERARARLEGVARFSNAGASRAIPPPRVPLIDKGEQSAIPTTLSVNATDDITDAENCFHEAHFRTKWAEFRPVVRNSSRVTGSVDFPIRNTPGLREKPSIASSRQFDSTTSSSGQWQREHPVSAHKENEDSEWQSDDSTSTSDQSLYPQRLDDQGQSGLGEPYLSRTESSQGGSFRFI